MGEEVWLAEPSDVSRRIRQAIGEARGVAPQAGPTVRIRVIGPDEIAAGGLRLLRRHRLHSPGVPVVVVADDATPVAEVRGYFREGALDVVWSSEIESGLPAAVERVLRRSDTGRARERESERLALELGKRARELEAALAAVREAYDQTLAALVSALDYRERETAWHSQRVAVYAVLLGMRIGLERAALERLYHGSLLHDIGKIGIPDAVLLKPGTFSEQEWRVMREHAEMGAAFLDRIHFLSAASDVPRAHHEGWDGNGYPRALAGVAIPLHARIFAVVDTYDAIRSARPYKVAYDHAVALQQLREAAGHRLDPELVEVFVHEPEETWLRLSSRVGESITFSSVFSLCRRVADL